MPHIGIVSHVGFSNPDGTSAMVLTNAGPEKKVRLGMARMMAEAILPADSVTTLNWR